MLILIFLFLGLYLVAGFLLWAAVKECEDKYWSIIFFWPCYLVFGVIWVIVKGGYETYKLIKAWDWSMKSYSLGRWRTGQNK